MNWMLQRYSAQNNSTQSLLFDRSKPIDKGFFCHAIEDDNEGGKGDKRIPPGVYKLKIHNFETPKTLLFRKSLPWFKFFIEITGIFAFDLVFIHPGNDQKDTEGCLLLNDFMGNNMIQVEKEGSYSRQACERFYALMIPYLESGAESFIEIREELKIAS